MTPVELSRTVLRAVCRAVDEGELAVTVPTRVVVERSRAGGCGDYATGVALQLARGAGRPALQVADVLRERLLASPGVGGVDITGPGFLNITLDCVRQEAALVRDVLARGTAYGHQAAGAAGETGEPQVVRLRVAPDVRAAVVADAIVRIVGSQGERVLLRYENGAGPDPAWAALGVDAGPEPMVAGGTAEPEAAGGTGESAGAPPAASEVIVRPVPAPADPLPLGSDAARWALLHPAVHDRPRISDDHLVLRESNPLFLVRYAHARTRALVRNAADLGFTPAAGDLDLTSTPAAGAPAATAGASSTAGGMATAPPARHNPAAQSIPAVQNTSAVQDTLPRHAPAAALTAALADYPTVLAAAARRRAPDRLARCLVGVGDAFLRFQEAVPILPMGDEKPSAAHRARLALAEAAGTVLAGGLTLLGIGAPDTL